MRSALVAMTVGAVLIAGCGSTSHPAATSKLTTPASPPASSAHAASTAHPTVTATATVTKTPARTTPTATSASSSGPAECSVVDLQVHDGDEDGASGHYFTAYYFVNDSSHSCVTQNFPGVQYLNRGAKPMEHKTHRGGGFGDFPHSGALIRLAPGGRASFELSAEDFDAAGNKSCRTSTYLAVYPPDETHRLIVRDAQPVCGDTIFISPLRPYRRGDAAHTDESK